MLEKASEYTGCLVNNDTSGRVVILCEETWSGIFSQLIFVEALCICDEIKFEFGSSTRALKFWSWTSSLE